MLLDLGAPTGVHPDVAAIHHATALYTADPAVERLLDRAGWPAIGGKLLDPGAGAGAIIIAALQRLSLAVNDVDGATAQLEAWEFFPGAAIAARSRFAAVLVSQGWSRDAAAIAAERIILVRDFLLEGPTGRRYRVIASNPPYLRCDAWPAGYRARCDGVLPSHARSDLLHAFLDRCAQVIEDDGRIAAITSDRWLANQGAAELRRRLGSSLADDVVGLLTCADRQLIASSATRTESRRAASR